MENKLLSITDQSILFIGVGGCGNNILEYVVTHLNGEYMSVAISDDKQTLRRLESVSNHILLSKSKLSEGDAKLLGAMSKQAKAACIFLGIGGRTGSSVSVTVLEQLKSFGLVTVVVGTTPFDFETSRIEVVEETLKQLAKADQLVTFSNQKLIGMASKNISMAESFEMLNQEILGLFTKVLQ